MNGMSPYLASMYPGGVPNWELLWLQNVLFVFAQFTTGAALFTQNTRYADPLLVPVGVLTRDISRNTLVLIHVVTGVLLVAANIVFVAAWIISQGGSIVDLLGTRSTMTLTSLLLTGGIAAMAVFGVSLYANIRPGSVLPLWKFDYAFSRKVHRGLFIGIVLLLGYHIFLTPRVVVVWSNWISTGEPFGILVLGIIAVWGILAGNAVLMSVEWLSGHMFSRWEVDRSGRASALGAFGAFSIALGLSYLDSTPTVLLLVGAAVAVAAFATSRLWPTHPPRS